MTIQHKSLRDEVLFVIGRSSQPLNSSEVYARCTLAEEMKQVSNALFQLKAGGKIDSEVVDGRPRYTLAKEASTPAPAGRPQEPPTLPPPVAAARVDAPIAAAADPTKTAPGADEVTKGLDLVEAATKARPARPDGAGKASKASDEGLADSILAKLSRQLAPVTAELQAVEGLPPLHIHIHIEQVDIHLGGL